MEWERLESDRNCLWEKLTFQSPTQEANEEVSKQVLDDGYESYRELIY
jgi:hypothetical protein